MHGFCLLELICRVQFLRGSHYLCSNARHNFLHSRSVKKAKASVAATSSNASKQHHDPRPRSTITTITASTTSTHQHEYTLNDFGVYVAITSMLPCVTHDVVVNSEPKNVKLCLSLWHKRGCSDPNHMSSQNISFKHFGYFGCRGVRNSRVILSACRAFAAQCCCYMATSFVV